MCADDSLKLKAAGTATVGTVRREWGSVQEIPVAAVVLAAGVSRRMGAENKLLRKIGGQPMVRWVVEAALASRARPVIVVTGHEADGVRQALDGINVRFADNPQFEYGLSTSVRAGVDRVPAGCAGALMLLGDMPRITDNIIDALIDGFRKHGGCAVCVPVCAGRRGNPVLWPRELFPDMMRLSGDVGARGLLKRHQARIEDIVLDSTSIFLDVDTPDDLKML